MMTYDFTPFYRSTIGFDRMAHLLENVARLSEVENNYPPYNIEAAGDDHYRLTLAVAGFSEDDISIEVHDNTLEISGGVVNEDDNTHYLHQGIASRTFTKQLRLADHVKVETAWMDNGLLTIDLIREVPEEMKPRKIAISQGTPKNILSKAKKLLGNENKAA